MALGVIALGLATRGTPTPSPFEPTWESLHGEPNESHPLVAAVRQSRSDAGVRADDVVLHRRAILPPPLAAFEHACESTHWRWMLPGYTNTRAESFVRASVEDRGQQDALLGVMQCDASGCAIDPPMAVLEALSPTSRARLYSELGRHEVNAHAAHSHRRRVADEAFSATPEMPAAAVPWVQRVEYTDRGVRYLVDAEVVCAHLTTVGERAAFVRSLNARFTVDASLRVSISDDALRNSVAPSLVAPALAAVHRAREAGQTEVPLDDLLPASVRARIGRYPTETEQDLNCFTSALSFRGELVRGVSTTASMRAHLRNGYQPVDGTSLRMGDVMLFDDPRGEAEHAVVYLMDSLVYTKNGFSPFEPWRISDLDDVQMAYPHIASMSVWRPRD